MLRHIDGASSLHFEVIRARGFQTGSGTPMAGVQQSGLDLNFSQVSFFGSLSSRILWPGAGLNPPWMDGTAGLMPPSQPRNPNFPGPIGGISMPPREPKAPGFPGPIGGISMPPQPELPQPKRPPLGGISMPPQEPRLPRFPDPIKEPGVPGFPGPIGGISMPPQPELPQPKRPPLSGISMPQQPERPQPKRPPLSGISMPVPG